MKAMILAAGKGTRVRPLTNEMPKPMIPIIGKPVMEYLIEELERHGFDEIMINVSHLPEKIEDYFGNGERLGVEIGYSFEGYIENGEIQSMALGSAGGIKRIQEFGGFFDDTFLVVCGDALIDLDLTAAVRQHWKSGAVASICTLSVEPEQVCDYGVVVSDENGQITSFQEKPAVHEALSNNVNTGIYIFEPEILDLIPSDQNYDIGGDLFPKIVEAGLPFHAIDLPFNWIDIGRISDYWEANQKIMQGDLRTIPMPGTQVRPGIWVGLNTSIDWDGCEIEGPVYIGSGTRVEAGAKIIGPTWIGHGCYIRENAYISKSIIFEYTRIGSASVVNESVAVGRFFVDKDGNSFESEKMHLDWVTDSRIPAEKLAS
ncbi:MAG: mannose-1-phosphate guanylyltransferase [Cryomorphaceae bacterium]|jgi:mannose-1-phosphate guanylyltransferase